MKNFLINKKSIEMIEPLNYTDKSDQLNIYLKSGYVISSDVQDLDNALKNASRFINKTEQFFTLEEFDIAVNEKYQPNLQEK